MADSQANGSSAATEQSPAPGTIERIRPRQLSQRDPGGLAKMIADSKFWKHITNPAQAMVVMAAGEELGLTPLAAVQGITIIEEKIGYTANLVATLIKEDPVHDYRVWDKTNERCKLEFGPAPAPGRDESGEWLPWPGAYGFSEFSVEDAQRAELVKPRSNWVKYPRAMCFNRALTEGMRAFCPDVTAGTPTYTDEEIREVIHVPSDVEEIADAQVAEEERPRLDDDRLDRLVQGYEIAGPELGGHSKLDGLNILLGSLGFDGHDLTDNFDIREVVSTWSPEQADAVLAAFEEAVDQAGAEEAEEVDGEVVPDGEEAQHADA